MNEKVWGVFRSQSQMDSFRQIMNLHGFKDLGIVALIILGVTCKKGVTEFCFA